ncbi:hydroxypyruvate reductase [Granulicella rosea]|uniref:Hydroxypyruvate reductase n=1 Tax=Granulicella rosea TaxID=474952 RepID=A0A239DZF6_9BACT|nr:DUF4147 domain-containing protein [Granulicella rosea]SNS37747.1 hydroxypyruvate reductase [Granulicella rosea]
MNDTRAVRRSAILEIHARTMARLDVRRVMEMNIRRRGRLLEAWDSTFDLGAYDRVLALAVGKAAAPMAEGLLQALDCVEGVDALVIAPEIPASQRPGVEYLKSSHPIPDASARTAALRAIERLRGCDARTLVFFLVSGGSSAMLELPLPAGFTDADVADFNRVLVHSGLPIREMNILRKHLSAVKGGRLAVLAGKAAKCTLVVSDVPSGMEDMVGSGPTLPDSSTVADCQAILAANPLPFAPRVAAWFADPALPETPKAGHPAFRNATLQTVLSSDEMCAFAAEIAVGLGYHVVIDNTCDEQPFDQAAEHLLARLAGLRLEHAKVCLLSAGEIAVPVSGTPGRGGRNQHFVLECARRIAAADERVTVLSAGSDGIDGHSPAAAAVADESSAARASAAGFNVEAALAGFDSYPLFAALGDAVVTGPSGNNVRDLRILLSVNEQ